MAEEHMTMRDLGFDFGPDPFGDKALAASLNAFVHKPGFSYAVGVLAACIGYWIWVMLRNAAEKRDSVVIAQGRESQVILRRDSALKELRGRDPGFEEALFLERAKAIFLKMQEASSRRQAWMARGCVSDGLYERLRDELDRQGAAGVHDRVSEVQITEATALGYVRATAPSGGIGTHWVLWSQIAKPFDPATPSMLLFDERRRPAENLKLCPPTKGTPDVNRCPTDDA